MLGKSMCDAIDAVLFAGSACAYMCLNNDAAKLAYYLETGKPDGVYLLCFARFVKLTCKNGGRIGLREMLKSTQAVSFAGETACENLLDGLSSTYG